jgi:iron complex outermembrane receptor protein
VINVITKAGKSVQGANLKASYGSFNTTKTSLSYANQLANGVETYTSGSFYHSHGNKHLYFKEFDTPATHGGISENNDQDQSVKLLSTVRYHDFTLQGLFVRRKKQLPIASFDTIFNSHDESYLDERIMVNAKYAHTFDNHLNLQGRASYNRSSYNGRYPYDYGTPDTHYVVNQDYSRAQWWQAEWQISQVFWQSHRFTFGGEFQDNFDQLLTNYDITKYFNAQTNSYRWAIFLQDEIDLTEKLSANLGLRFDYYSTSGTTINPRASLIYEVNNNNTVKLLYGSAFRAPNQFEMNYRGTGIITNTHLKPELFKTLEFILQHRFNQHLNAEVNVFYTTMKDLIRFTEIDNGVFQNRNLGRVHSTGMEAQVEGKWATDWQMRLSYSWQSTIDQSTQHGLSNSPEHMVKLNVIAPLGYEKLFAGFETRYLSSRKNASDAKVPDYVVSNLTVFSQDAIVKGLELSGGVYNLFNQRYFDPSSPELKQTGIQQDRLTFRIKASLSF